MGLRNINTHRFHKIKKLVAAVPDVMNLIEDIRGKNGLGGFNNQTDMLIRVWCHPIVLFIRRKLRGINNELQRILQTGSKETRRKECIFQNASQVSGGGQSGTSGGNETGSVRVRVNRENSNASPGQNSQSSESEYESRSKKRRSKKKKSGSGTGKQSVEAALREIREIQSERKRATAQRERDERLFDQATARMMNKIDDMVEFNKDFTETVDKTINAVKDVFGAVQSDDDDDHALPSHPIRTIQQI